ncbi:MAG: glycosyltransferase family 2 protein [Magnetococcales bacterium]|nr:glycosyltransferase family 2 protein [Magnetococcales bacterium]
MLCSVIITAFNEQQSISTLCESLSNLATKENSMEWEFILIDDGSTDQTATMFAEVNKADQRFKLVSLSRNFGGHIAEVAGLHYCSGDAAVFICADLQSPPKEITRLLECWHQGFDVVWAVRNRRYSRWMDFFTSHLFAAIIRRIALPNYPPTGTGGFVLLDRKVIEALKSCPEHNRMNAGLILSAGFRQTSISYDWQARHAGSSKWTITRKIRLFVDTVVSFSTLPIHVISLTGMALSVLGILYAVFLLLNFLLYDKIVSDWTTLMLVILILGGMQLTVLGVLGEYLWRTLDNSRRRPLFFVREVMGEFPHLQVPPLNTGLPTYRKEIPFRSRAADAGP